MSTFHQLWSKKDQKSWASIYLGLYMCPSFLLSNIIFGSKHHFRGLISISMRRFTSYWLKSHFCWWITVLLAKFQLFGLTPNRFCSSHDVQIVWQQASVAESPSLLDKSTCFLFIPCHLSMIRGKSHSIPIIYIISISRHGAAMVRPSHRGGLVWPCMVFTGLPLRRSTSRRVESSRPQATCAGVRWWHSDDCTVWLWWFTMI